MKCSEGFSQKMLSAAIGVGAGIIMIGVIVGFVGNGIVSTGIHDFIDRIVNTIEDVEEKSLNITTTMSQVPNYFLHLVYLTKLD